MVMDCATIVYEFVRHSARSLKKKKPQRARVNIVRNAPGLQHEHAPLFAMDIIVQSVD